MSKCRDFRVTKSFTQIENFMVSLRYQELTTQSLVLVKILGTLSYNVQNTNAKFYLPFQYQELTS